MSTSWYGTLDMPIGMDPDDALSTFMEAADRTRWRTDADLGPFHHVSIADGIAVDLPTIPTNDDPEPKVIDGRLVASLAFENLERPVGEIDAAGGTRSAPATQIHDTRTRIEVLFEILTRICDAPVGTFVGSLMCENDEGDASPLIVTTEGVRMLVTTGSYHLAYSYGHDPEEFPDQGSVPADLIRRHDDWSWTVDLDGLRKRLRGVVVDGRASGVIARLP